VKPEFVMSNLEFDEFIAKNYVSLMDYVIYRLFFGAKTERTISQ